MKMMPIKFRVDYSDENISFSRNDTKKGFAAIKGEKENIWARFVEIEFHSHSRGTYMQVRICEEVSPKTLKEVDGYTVYDKVFDRKLYELDIYDNPSPNSEFAICPTAAQALLMNAMHTGDIRGKYAEEIVNQLYVDLVVLHPKSEFGKYLPKVKEFFEDWVAKGYW